MPPRGRAGPTSWVRLGDRLDGLGGGFARSGCRPPATGSQTAAREILRFLPGGRGGGTEREREREPMPTDVERGGNSSLTSVPSGLDVSMDGFGHSLHMVSA